jgi:hypothetical protein
MWALFTKALARGTSTTQVSILNTSSNFMITAILGLLIFGESLPPLWFLGAALLVAGNVIIGRRDEGADDKTKTPATAEVGYDIPETGTGEGRYRNTGGSEEQALLVRESGTLDGDLEFERMRQQQEEEEDILHLASGDEREELV